MAEDLVKGRLSDIQSINRYLYVKDNSLLYIDPIGLDIFNYDISEPDDIKDSKDNNALFQQISALYNLTKQYNSGYQELYRTQLILQFIRKHGYADSAWDEVAGAIDYEFINFVESERPDVYEYFEKNHCIVAPDGNRAELFHFAAVLNALIYNADGYRVFFVGEHAVDDLAGWAGDLQTLMKDTLAQQQKDNIPTNYDAIYALSKEMFGDEEYHFGMLDFYSDMDAVNVNNYIFAGLSLVDSLNYYYTEAYVTRFRTFTHNDSKSAIRIAVGEYTSQYWFAPFIKWPLFESVPGDKPIPFVFSKAVGDMFTDTLWEMVEKEKVQYGDA